MSSIEISDFEEKEYNLSGLGLEGFYFCIEENVKYVYGPNFYIEINDKTLFEKVEDNYILKGEDEETLSIPAEEFDILKQLIFD